jgi:hypothetical protein
MPEPYADTLATVAAGRTALVERLRTIASRVEELPLESAAEVLVLLEPAVAVLEREAALALERAPSDRPLSATAQRALLEPARAGQVLEIASAAYQRDELPPDLRRVWRTTLGHRELLFPQKGVQNRCYLNAGMATEPGDDPAAFPGIRTSPPLGRRCRCL